MIDAILNPERQVLVAAVDRRRRGVDHVPGPDRPREFEHVAMPDEVRLNVRLRVLDAVANARLRPEVDDAVERVGAGERLERLRVRKIHSLEAEAFAEPAGEIV